MYRDYLGAFVLASHDRHMPVAFRCAHDLECHPRRSNAITVRIERAPVRRHLRVGVLVIAILNAMRTLGYGKKKS
ncbi:MAG: hypothetical protein V8T53_10115 [Eubacteriales bacterium]